MSTRIKLVQGDTKPQILCSITDDTTGNIVDISGSTVYLKFRAEGTTTVLFTLLGNVQSGILDSTGNITQAGTGQTYAVAGSGGLVAFQFGTGNLLVDPGLYEGEIEVTFSTGAVQTVYAPVKFSVRAQF